MTALSDAPRQVTGRHRPPPARPLTRLTLTRAGLTDLKDVLRLINGARARLHEQGVRQWPNEFTAARIGPMVARGEVLIVRATRRSRLRPWRKGAPVATAAVSPAGDPDFWTERELAEPAIYISKVARADGFPGAGELLLRWITSAADAAGYRWVRLDAWRTNEALHGYYARRGWTRVRTEAVAGRNSGALFQRLALAGPEAEGPIVSRVTLPAASPPPCGPLAVLAGHGVVARPGEHEVAARP